MVAKVLTYLLRDMPPDLWDTVQARAKSDHRSVREVILACLEIYAEHGLPTRKPFTPGSPK